MTDNDFRRLALSFPEAVESEHMKHPDFRVGGKIFATLSYPEEGLGMVKLTLEQQKQFVQAEPEVFAPVKGGWGRKGATNVRLKAATKTSLSKALTVAWCNRAPKGLAEKFKATKSFVA